MTSEEFESFVDEMISLAEERGRAISGRDPNEPSPLAKEYGQEFDDKVKSKLRENFRTSLLNQTEIIDKENNEH